MDSRWFLLKSLICIVFPESEIDPGAGVVAKPFGRMKLAPELPSRLEHMTQYRQTGVNGQTDTGCIFGIKTFVQTAWAFTDTPQKCWILLRLPFYFLLCIQVWLERTYRCCDYAAALFCFQWSMKNRKNIYSHVIEKKIYLFFPCMWNILCWNKSQF